jgi:hypothetical protein
MPRCEFQHLLCYLGQMLCVAAGCSAAQSVHAQHTEMPTLVSTTPLLVGIGPAELPVGYPTYDTTHIHPPQTLPCQ